MAWDELEGREAYRFDDVKLVAYDLRNPDDGSVHPFELGVSVRGVEGWTEERVDAYESLALTAALLRWFVRDGIGRVHDRPIERDLVHEIRELSATWLEGAIPRSK